MGRIAPHTEQLRSAAQTMVVGGLAAGVAFAIAHAISATGGAAT